MTSNPDQAQDAGTWRLQQRPDLNWEYTNGEAILPYEPNSEELLEALNALAQDARRMREALERAALDLCRRCYDGIPFAPGTNMHDRETYLAGCDADYVREALSSLRVTAASGPSGHP